MTLDEARAVHDALVLPESRNVARSVAGKDAHIDFKKPHAPLLLIGGEKDTIVPWKINEKTFRAYKDPNSIREFKLLQDAATFCADSRAGRRPPRWSTTGCAASSQRLIGARIHPIGAAQVRVALGRLGSARRHSRRQE
jgi:dienelactone hydrolase